MRNVVVTFFAIQQIKSIYDYHNLYASLKVAKKLKLEIIAAIKTLKFIDVEWQIDEFLICFNKKSIGV